MEKFFRKILGENKKPDIEKSPKKPISRELRVNDILRASLRENKIILDNLKKRLQELEYYPPTPEDRRIQELSIDGLNKDIDETIASIERDLESTRGVFGEKTDLEPRRDELVRLKNEIASMKKDKRRLAA